MAEIIWQASLLPADAAHLFALAGSSAFGEEFRRKAGCERIAAVQQSLETGISLTAVDFEIVSPFGLDTYILVACEDELDPRIFPAKGVRTRSGSRGTGNPLADLIQNIGVNRRSRGVEKPVPTNWSVQKVTFRSVAANKAAGK